MAHKKKVTTLDEAIRDMSEESKKSVLEDDDSTPMEGVEEGLVQDQEKHAASLVNGIPQGAGWYAKVYRKTPVPDYLKGRPLLVYDFKDLSLIQDYESELLSVGVRNGWEDGLYEVHTMKVGEPGRKERQFALQFPKVAPKEAPALQPENAQQNPIEYLSAASKFIGDIIKEQKGNMPEVQQVASQNPVDPAAMVKAYGELLTSIQASQPPPQPGVDWATIISAIVPILAPTPAQPTRIAEILTAVAPMIVPVLTAMVAPKNDNFVAGLASAKEAGLVGQPVAPQPDLFKQINAFKEAGLLTQPQDAFAQIEKIAGVAGVLMPIFEKLGGGKGDGNTSVMVELVRSLGPQVGKIVSDVTGTVNTAIQAKQMVAQKANTQRVTRQPAQDITPVAAQPPSPPPTPSASQPKTIGLAPLVTAIEMRDKKFFPELKKMIITSFTQDGYDGIVSGEITVPDILTQLAPYHEIFKDKRASIYFNEFVVWAKSSELDVVCIQCKSAYVFDIKDEFMSKEHFCEDCGGRLILVSDAKAGVGTEEIGQRQESEEVMEPPVTEGMIPEDSPVAGEVGEVEPLTDGIQVEA